MSLHRPYVFWRTLRGLVPVLLLPCCAGTAHASVADTYSLAVATLDGTNGFKVNGRDANASAAFSDQAGIAVAGIGDVNRDGYPNLLVGAWRAEAGVGAGNQNTGEAYVVFGSSTANLALLADGTSGLDLSRLDGSQGITIEGDATSGQLGAAAGGGGDFNGDGVPDLLLGEQSTGPSESRAYTVFGARGAAFGALNGIVVSKLGPSGAGVGLGGIPSGTGFPTVVADAGDVDRDGTDDLLVGNAGMGVHGTNSGQAFLVFGGTNLGALNPLGGANASDVLSLNGAGAGAYLGRSVAGIGDVNGDGYPDFAVGATADSGMQGEAYVIFGAPRSKLAALVERIDSSGIDAVLDGSNGLVLKTPPLKPALGYSVTGIGDFNGDGYGDFAVSGPQVSEIFVIYGRAGGFPASINLASFLTAPSGGFMIEGSFTAGTQIASAGDFNGDGLADLIIGNPGTDHAYVLYGNADIGALLGPTPFYTSFGVPNARVLDLTDGSSLNGGGNPDGAGHQLLAGGTLAGKGLRLTGLTSSGFGTSVAGLGDINQDGYADVVVGAPRAANATQTDSLGSGNAYAGQAYVIYGGNYASVANTQNTITYQGLVSPGSGPGCTSEPGNVVLDASATLVIEVGGTTACTQYDRFGVANNLTVNGATLKLVFLNGYVPSPGQSFRILRWASEAGRFGSVDTSLAPLPDGLTWDYSALYANGTLTLSGARGAATTVPMPAWSLAVLAGALWMARRAGERRAGRRRAGR